MAVYVSNLVVNQGADFSQTFTLEDALTNAAKNLTGHSVAAKMRKHHAASNSTSFTAAVSSASGGQVKISLTDTQTADLAPGRHVYDVLLTAPDGMKSRVVEGMVLVRDGVT